MARKDARALRDEVASAIDKGKWKRAIECIQELEQLEPRDASWPKRAAEVYRRLGKPREAIAAYERAIDRYAQGGFLVQAIAVAKQILQLDPKHTSTLQRLAAMTEERQTSPHGMRSIGVAAEAIPELVVGRATGPVQKIDPATLVGVDMLDLPDRRSRPIAAPTPPEPEPEPDAAEMDFSLPEEAPSFPLPVAPPPVAPPPRAAAASASPALATASVAPPPPAPPPVRPPAVTPPIGYRPPSSTSPPPRRPDGTLPVPPRLSGPAGARPPASPPPIPPPIPPLRKRRSSPPPYGAQKRKRPESAPILLEKGAPLDSVPLASIMPGAEAERRDDGLSSGIIVIPLEELDDGTGPIDIETLAQEQDETVEVPLDAVETPEPVPVEDLDLEAMDDGDFAASHSLSATAARAMRATPLLAGLDGDQLEALVAKMSLVQLDPGQVLFKEGDQGDTLFIVSEGEVAVISEGPPRRELSRLLPGSFFGEIALITEQARSATIAAVARTELLAIDRDVVRGLVAEHPDTLRVILLFIKNRLVERVIQTSPLFVPFSEPDRRSLAERFDFLEVEPGTRLITQGARPDGLYVILSGRAEAERDLGGAVRKLGSLGTGEVFGEMALWGAEAAVATVRAQEKMLALRMPAGDFRQLIMTHPQVLAYVGDLAEERRRAAEGPPEDSGDVVDLKLDLI